VRLALLDGQSGWHAPGDQPTRLHVLRHGEVAERWRTVLYGQIDVELSPRGEEQSRRTGAAMAGLPLVAVYTSDLRRAATLGREIARHHGLEPVVTPALRERHFGHWQGLPWQSVAEQWPDEHRQYELDRFTVRAPGGAENFHDVAGRVLEVGREIVARHPGQQVAIACHSGPARILLGAALHLPLDSLFTFDLDYCSLSTIDIHPSGRVRLVNLNGTAHLGDSPMAVSTGRYS
jgi:broad specificity phosphatase PhoE